jgi:hypothetical protein
MSINFWMGVRTAVMLFLDTLERELIARGVHLEPRTAELRKMWKEKKLQQSSDGGRQTDGT